MRKINLVVMVIIIGLGAFMLVSCSRITRNPKVKLTVAQDNSYSKPGNNYYQELTDQSPDNSDNMSYPLSDQWSGIKNDVSVSLVSSNTRFPKNLIPKISLQDTCYIKSLERRKS